MVNYCSSVGRALPSERKNNATPAEIVSYYRIDVDCKKKEGKKEIMAYGASKKKKDGPVSNRPPSLHFVTTGGGGGKAAFLRGRSISLKKKKRTREMQTATPVRFRAQIFEKKGGGEGGKRVHGRPAAKEKMVAVPYAGILMSSTIRRQFRREGKRGGEIRRLVRKGRSRKRGPWSLKKRGQLKTERRTLFYHVAKKRGGKRAAPLSTCVFAHIFSSILIGLKEKRGKKGLGVFQKSQ